MRSLLGTVAFSMNQPATANDLNEGLQDHAMNRGAPPHVQDPVSGPANLMGSLFTSFGPNFLLQGMAFMNTAQNAAATRTTEARKQNLETPGNSRLNTYDRRGSDESVEERKRRPEAELASLPGSGVQGYQVDSPPLNRDVSRKLTFLVTPRTIVGRVTAVLPREGVVGSAGVRTLQVMKGLRAIEYDFDDNPTNYLYILVTGKMRARES